MTTSDLVNLSRPGSLADRAYQVLRGQIAAGGLAAGSKVTERGLATGLGISPTPVREALRRLEQDRLVQRSGLKGMRVADHSGQAIGELVQAEIALRATAASIAAGKISKATLAELAGLIDAAEAELGTAVPEVQLSRARSFDDLVLAAADNDVLAGLIDSVSVFSWPARLRAARAMAAGDLAAARNRIRAHRRILAALRKGDADLTEALMREHLAEATAYLLSQAADARPSGPGMSS
jgi:DNA-binding GntR family transcriptional regulator